MSARKPKRTRKLAAIVTTRAEEPNLSTLPASTQLPLGLLATASRPTLQQLMLDRIGRAEGSQRAMTDLLQTAVWDLVTAELARMLTDGVLEQVPTPKNQAAATFEHQRATLRIRAAEILAQEHSELEPFFRPKVLSDEILRRCHISHRRRWALYYASYGCIVCGTTDRPHFSTGLCEPCWAKITDRLRCLGQPRARRRDGRGRQHKAPYLLEH